MRLDSWHTVVYLLIVWILGLAAGWIIKGQWDDYKNR
jgi:hypothetical protein